LFITYYIPQFLKVYRRCVFHAYLRKDQTGDRNLEKHFFLCEHRAYLKTPRGVCFKTNWTKILVILLARLLR